MANPNRTTYTGPPLSGPGIMWVNSVPTSPLLSHDTFNTWYEKYHIPDILAAKPASSTTQGCAAAWRFKARDSTRLRPYLALYSVPDMGFIQSPEFGKISMYNDMLPEGGPCQKFVHFDTRFYQRVQVFEKPSSNSESSKGIGKVIKSTAIQPASGMEEEFDSWYREEHLQQVSEIEGWRKSTRYELIFKIQSANVPVEQREDAPKYLAIHEFEEGSGVERMPKEKWTEWTKRIVSSADKIDEGVFDFVWGMGGEDATL